MKVKRLRDGKIVEVEKHGDAIIDENGKVMYFDEVCEVDGPDWQQVRIQAAIAAMNIVKGAYNIHNDVERFVHHSVRIADALIEELKKGGQDGRD